MRNLKIIAFNTLFVLIFTTFSSWAGSEQKSPEASVKTLLNEIKQIVEGNGLSDAKKAANKKHSDIAVSILEIQEISQKALGKYWKKQSAEQKDQFQKLLGDLFVHVAFPSSAKFFASLDLMYGKSQSKKGMTVIPITVIHEKEGEIYISF